MLKDKKLVKLYIHEFNAKIVYNGNQTDKTSLRFKQILVENKSLISSKTTKPNNVAARLLSVLSNILLHTSITYNYLV